MPVPKTKRTTSTPNPSTSDPSSPVLPEQQVFHHYLRTLAQSAVRVVIETVMREELDQFIGAAWGECSRQQQRVPQRPLHPRSGDIYWSARGDQRAKTTARVSSTRRPLNATAAMNRTLPKDATGMFVAGTSTHKVGEVAQTLQGVARSRQHDQSLEPNAHPAI
jgi:putative transposase